MDAALRIAIICGSSRADSNSAKACRALMHQLQLLGVGQSFFDPSTVVLPTLGDNFPDELVQRLREMVGQADGIVLCTPEYDGSYSAVLKGVIENLGYPSVLMLKPIALMGVASGRIGAVKAIEHLRGVCAHVGAVVMPTAISIPEVHKAFDTSGNCTDPAVQARMAEMAKQLCQQAALVSEKPATFLF